MTFRQKLTFTFTTLVAGILVIICLLIYFLAERYQQQEFYARLQERATITAQMFLESDELSGRTLTRIRRKFFQSLPEEVLDIYDKKRHPQFILDSLKMVAPANIFEQLDKKKFVEFRQGNKQGVGFIYVDNQGSFYIIVSAQDLYGNNKLKNLQQILFFCTLAGVLVAFFLGHFFSGQVLQPIIAIVKEVNMIRASNLHLRVRERGSNDEIGQLTKTFNKMLERLENSFEMQKDFIANASHELRNPLTAISGEIEVTLLKERSAAEYQKSLETLQNETERLQKLTTDLINLAQAGFDEQEINRDRIRLDEIILEVKNELDQQLPGNKIQLDFSGLPASAEQVMVSGSRHLIKIALTNVLENASKFSDSGPVFLTLQHKNDKLLITVRDSGIGIPAEEIKHVFEPFYRAGNARSRKGTGIGLSMTEKIMRLHHGKITLRSELGNGTQITLKFPAKTV